jgi:putative N6-adenine-specific DNA methylase
LEFIHPITSFKKRIKRQIVARTAEFFAATSPGLEPVCLRELQALSLVGPKGHASLGGVPFNGRLHDGFLANLCLRTANRVLMRIGAFTASNFSALEKKLAGIPWELYLHPYQPLRFNVTAHHSRLYHGTAISDRFQKVIAARLAQSGVDPRPGERAAPDQRIFIRVVDDQFTVSLDSSGENLYRRGLKRQVTAAPLRETIAAALLMLAGYCPPEPLVDPMCGAGSFSLEAAMRAHNIPAGWFRDFAFYAWPAFALTHKRWKHLKNRFAQRIVNTAEAAIFAADIDPAACKALEENAANSGLSASIAVSNRDFFDLTPREFGASKGLLTINPPFGRRIGSPKQSDAMFQDLCNRLEAVWRGWRVALVVPRKALLKRIPFPYSAQEIRHGGLRFFLAAGRLPS